MLEAVTIGLENTGKRQRHLADGLNNMHSRGWETTPPSSKPLRYLRIKPPVFQGKTKRDIVGYGNWMHFSFLSNFWT